MTVIVLHTESRDCITYSSISAVITYDLILSLLHPLFALFETMMFINNFIIILHGV